MKGERRISRNVAYDTKLQNNYIWVSNLQFGV